MRILFTFALILLSFIAFSQQVTWSSAVTVAPNTYSNLHPRIALDRSNNPMVLWGNAGNNRAYFSRWTGTAFSTPVTMNPSGVSLFAASWAGPDLTSHGDTVYVSMKQSPEDTGHMYVARSTNGGTSFSTPVRADYIGMNVSRFPILTTDNNGNPIMAFMKFNMGFGNAHYVVSKSSDFGNTFGTDVLATKTGDSVCDCCPASIICSGNNVIMSYRANKGNIRDMWSCISTNTGTSFPNAVNIDQNNWNLMSCPSSGPDAVTIGDSIYAVFMNGASGKSLVYFNRASISMASANMSSPVTGNFSGLNSQNFPRIANAGTAIGVVWIQNAGMTILAMKFTDSISKGLPAKYDTLAMGTITNADIIMSPGKVYVVWQDDASGTIKYRMGTYVLPSSVATLANREYVSIYPNPVKDEFYISTPNVNIASCAVIDNSGKRIEIMSHKVNDKIAVSVHGIAAGVYYLLFTDIDGQAFYSKLIVEK